MSGDINNSTAVRSSNNFDMLRLVMALSVFFVHSFDLSGSEGLKFLTSIFSSTVAVNSFFIISGFLIFMSYDRSSSLRSYMEKRVRRIAPAYIAVVTICAFAGLLVSSYGFSGYFTLDWLKYYGANILTLNFLEPALPGVFMENKYNAVNGALWTIKIEVMFYVSVPIVAYFLSRYNKALVCIVIYVLSVVYFLYFTSLYDHTGQKIYWQLSLLLPGSMSFFISGALLYYYQDSFSEKKYYMLAAGVAGYLIYKYSGYSAVFYPIMPISLALIIIYFATAFYYVGNWARYGDLSYGVYIWHFPVVQLLIYKGYFQMPVVGLVMSFVIVFLCAFLSWHIIEKRALMSSSHYIKASSR